MTTEPQPLHRNIINAGVFPVHMPFLNKGTYEVLEEMFQMWFQCWDAWDAIKKAGGRYSTHGELVYVVAETRRNGWEEAIMLYCGWNGTELNHWLAEKMEERGRIYDV